MQAWTCVPCQRRSTLVINSYFFLFYLFLELVFRVKLSVLFLFIFHSCMAERFGLTVTKHKKYFVRKHFTVHTFERIKASVILKSIFGEIWTRNNKTLFIDLKKKREHHTDHFCLCLCFSFSDLKNIKNLFFFGCCLTQAKLL